MTKVNFSNYKTILHNGTVIIYGSHKGIVYTDIKYNGGFKCGGRSIPNILEEYDDVMVVA